MTISIPSDADRTAALALPALCDLAAAPALLTGFRAALDAGAGLRIDAAAADRITTPCAQILLSARAFCAERDLPFIIEQVSDALAECLGDLGLGFLLQTDM